MRQTTKIFRCKTLLLPFFHRIWGFILKKWLPIYDLKYCPTLGTTFFHLSDNCSRNLWAIRGSYRMATKLATVYVTRAKQPKHRRERMAQARASHPRVAFPHAQRGIHGGEKPRNAKKPGCGLGKDILAAPRCAHSYRLSGERKIVIATSPSRR